MAFLPLGCGTAPGERSAGPCRIAKRRTIRHDLLSELRRPSRPHPVVGRARIAELRGTGNAYRDAIISLCARRESPPRAFPSHISSSTWLDYRILTLVTIGVSHMTLSHKALAAALLCGAIGFALPS